MGAARGHCGGPGNTGTDRRIHLASGSYPDTFVSLVQGTSIEGAERETARIEGTVIGLRTGASLKRLSIVHGLFGGIVVSGGQSPAIDDCDILENGSQAIFVTASSPRLTQCTIARNNGGVLCESSALPEFSACIVIANSGWGLRTKGASPNLINTVVASNPLSGVYAEGSSVMVLNCTLVGSDIVPSGLIAFDSTIRVVNSIVGGEFLFFSEDPAIPEPAVSFSLIQGAAPWPGAGNLGGRPEFQSLGAFDFFRYRDVDIGPWSIRVPDFTLAPADLRLIPGSPGLDAANPQLAPLVDINGVGRPCGSGVDMGAYESGSCVFTPIKFQHGDVNADRRKDISDALTLLGFLFLGSPKSLLCDFAADINGDGTSTSPTPRFG